MVRRTSVWLALLVIVAGTARAHAQDRVVTGVVFDSLSGEPVAEATLYLQGRRDEYTADSYGRFRIAGVHEHDSLLVIRRIGYVPARVPLIHAPEALAIDLGTVRVKAVATRLDQIQVETEEVNRYPQLADFYRRKQGGRPGLFLTREEIARTGARRTSEMLRRTTKVEMDCAPQFMGSDGCVARSRRGRQVQRMFSDAATGRNRQQNGVQLPDTTEITFSAERCQMEVWVDGMRSSLAVDEIPLQWVAGVEVYTGLAQTPAVFGHGACGVVAIWTTRAGG